MNVDYIERLLEFAQADLTNVLEPEKERYLLEVKKILAGIHEHPPILVDEEPFSWQDVLAFQEEWLNALDWLHEQLNDFCSLSFTYNMRGLCHWPSKDREGTFDLITEYNGASIDVIGICISPDGIDRKIKVKFPRGAVYLFAALHHFPPAALGRCANCEKLFFNPTKRKQIYCSPTCRNAAGVSRYREKTEVS